ncbi:MAG: ATP-binding protein, partial [Elusimicrobiaceae bacterium]|nr:ATP-binding protein [Elusimicrobiaceae bacterium]
MLFDKPIHELTFDDVVAFCKRGLPENKQLDYKYMLPKNHEKFAKTIASFANTMGGTIIVGVQDDKNDKPSPPFLGIAYHEKVRNSIEDIIKTNIDPVVFVDINICLNKRGDRMFVVIDIPQSNLTPHLVGKLKRAYIRTGQSSRPETIVHPDKLPWLLDHRQKSERLRHILYDKAES